MCREEQFSSGVDGSFVKGRLATMERMNRIKTMVKVRVKLFMLGARVGDVNFLETEKEKGEIHSYSYDEVLLIIFKMDHKIKWCEMYCNKFYAEP